MEQFRQYVAAQPVGAQRQRPVVEGRQERGARDAQRITGKEKRGRQRHGDQRGQDDRARDRFRRAEKAGETVHAPASPAPTRGSSAA